jgi:hypothetical protein
MTYTAHITGRNGIVRRIALISTDRDDALQEARLLGLTMFPAFTYSVRMQ